MEGTLVIRNDCINTDTDTEYLVQFGYAFFDPTSSMLIIDTVCVLLPHKMHVEHTLERNDNSAWLRWRPERSLAKACTAPVVMHTANT